MDTNNNNNRLFLNFGNGNDRLAANDRAYPTTPSTFPQPVFPPQQSAQQAGGLHPGQQQQQPQQQQQYAGYNNADYFAQNQYQQQYQQQQQPAAAYGSAQNTAYQPRSGTPGTNDPNTGLAQQFSQLSGGARASPYGAVPSSQRPRTANAPGQPAYSGYVNAPPMPSHNSAPAPAAACEFQPAPERNPDKYGPTANNNQKRCSQLAADFFKDSVKRARERNQR